MKKALVSTLIIVFLVFALSAEASFCFAETRLGEINVEIEGLIEEENLNSKEGYTLVYEGDRLLEEGVGEEEEVQKYVALRSLYHKIRAKDSVEKACDDDYLSVAIGNDKLFFFEAQYEKVKEYREEFLVALDGDEDPYILAQNFFDKVELLPDVNTILIERNSYVEESLRYVAENVVAIANDSLEARGFNNRFEVKSGEDEEFYSWLGEVLNSVFFSEDAEIILEDYKEVVTALNDLPDDSVREDYLALAHDFINGLDGYRKRTATFEEGVKAVAMQSAKDALANLVLDSKSQKPAYQKKVQEVVDNALSKLENAQTPKEINEIVTDAQTQVSKIEIKDYRWVWLLVLAIVIFVGSGAGVTVFFKVRARRAGVRKYSALLEDERERIEKEITDANSKENDSDISDITTDESEREENGKDDE